MTIILQKEGNWYSFSVFPPVSSSRWRLRDVTHSIFNSARCCRVWKQTDWTKIISVGLLFEEPDSQTWFLWYSGIRSPNLPRRVWRGRSIYSNPCLKLLYLLVSRGFRWPEELVESLVTSRLSDFGFETASNSPAFWHVSSWRLLENWNIYLTILG